MDDSGIMCRFERLGDLPRDHQRLLDGNPAGNAIVEVDGLRLPLPRVADLMVEKLLTDRTGEKGARDLLVVAGLLLAATPSDLAQFVIVAQSLSDEAQHAIHSALTVLSLMQPHPGMPDPAAARRHVQGLLAAMEQRRG